MFYRTSSVLSKMWRHSFLVNVVTVIHSKPDLGPGNMLARNDPYAGSKMTFPMRRLWTRWPVFKNCHVSRFCFIFQVIQVILSERTEEVDLSFVSITKPPGVPHREGMASNHDCIILWYKEGVGITIFSSNCCSADLFDFPRESFMFQDWDLTSWTGARWLQKAACWHAATFAAIFPGTLQ